MRVFGFNGHASTINEILFIKIINPYDISMLRSVQVKHRARAAAGLEDSFVAISTEISDKAAVVKLGFIRSFVEY